MRIIFKIFLFLFFMGTYAGFSQQLQNPDQLKPNPEKEKKFSPYIQWKHGWTNGFAAWKEANTLLYYQELWYYSESFYVKRDHLATGITLDESIIDISRFESSRKEHEEAIVLLPGIKDALVLLPADKLIYKP